MLIFTHVCSSCDNPKISLTLALTAEQRRRSHQRLELDNGKIIHLRLPRGTVLREGDILKGENPDIFVEIKAKPESVITVTANNHLDLLKAAYHLGNRHIPLEINPHYLRLNSDDVLAKMLIQLGLKVKEEITPFYPEVGAYHHHHD